MSVEDQTTPPPGEPPPSDPPPGEPADLGLDTGQLAVAPTARRSRRRRRPSGAAPPLPRSLGTTGKGWLVAVVLLVAWVIITLISPWARRVTNQVDAAVIRVIVNLRVEWLSKVLRAVNRVSIGWAVTVVGLSLLVALVVFRRWRHLFTFLASVAIAEILGKTLLDGFARPRPFDVTIIDRWKGFSLPSAPVAVVTLLLIGIVYTMVVPGRPRVIAKIAVAITLAVLCFARIYLGVDHPFDDLVAIALFVAVPLNGFRFFTPNEVFPVTYHRGKTAHLDVEGRRGEAIRSAVHDQLGVTVVDIKPVGLEGSGGSTPLRLRVAGDPDTYTFGKLYAMSHVRADRWYKLGRTILYGRLEDEAPFQSVRRLVEYEDYALRLVRDSGIHTAAPLGIVEMTPEREYLLVTEFFDGAQEIGDAEVDDSLIDQGLMLVRQLWDAGLAHRDIKPANLLVRDGQLIVIDVAFAQVRPSPWRQAVDLANMMLVLAVRTDAERVYERALQYFTPDEIAEAFAATRGVASPTQLRMAMKQDGRNLMEQFRALAPERRPISLQRWSAKRVLLALGLLVGAFVTAQIVFPLFVPAEPRSSGTPSCGTSNLMVLMAQSVPEASSLPCLAALPAGWTLDGVEVKRGRTRFWLNSDPTGPHAVAVTLLPTGSCRVDQAIEVPSEEVGMQRFEEPERLPPGLRTTRTYVFPGGCVTYQFAFGPKADAAMVFAADSALAFQPREPLVALVKARSGGLRLCGADAPPCPGGT